jgi:hypothetical protein
VNILPLILGVIFFAVLLAVVGLVLLIKHRRLPK